MKMDEFLKEVSTLIESINTKADKLDACNQLAQLFIKEHDKIDIDIINKSSII